jgi:predicted nucleic acid-binding protein
MTRLYIDSNAFISAFEKSDAVSERLRELFLRRPGQVPLLVTSILAVAELLVKPIALKRHDLIRFYEAWTTAGPHLDMIDVTRDILLRAAQIRADSPSLKLPDAIHLATAWIAGCTHLVTNDLKMKPPFPIVLTRLVAGEVDALARAVESGH